MLKKELEKRYKEALKTIEELERDVECMRCSIQTTFVRCANCKLLHDKGWRCGCGYDASRWKNPGEFTLYKLTNKKL